MKFRKLRIAWSVFFGMLCMLLITLWVRSFWRFDTVRGCPKGNLTVINVYCGEITIERRSPLGFQFRWQMWYLPNNGPQHQLNGLEMWKYDRLGSSRAAKGWHVAISIWLPTLISGILAVVPAVPWNRWLKRFSLRTLLIVMTVVSVALALIVGLSRR